jgi:hypothetical protein
LGDFVHSASASFQEDLAEAGDRLRLTDTAKALERRYDQHEINEKTGAKGDEEKDAEITELAISRHDTTKLTENRRAHKRFSLARTVRSG